MRLDKPVVAHIYYFQYVFITSMYVATLNHHLVYTTIALTFCSIVRLFPEKPLEN